MSTIDLSKVTVVVPTFLRPGYVHRCLVGIFSNLPECPVAIACDDGGYTDLSPYAAPYEDVKWVQLPFDSGLTAKRNAAVQLVETPYTLIASDDFDFSGQFVKNGVERMVRVLDHHQSIDAVCGTYNNKEYEGRLIYKPGEYIAERRIPDTLGGNTFWDHPHAVKIEIGINYFLARTNTLREVPWDETIRPIGGEHADWFMMMKDRYKTVAWVPGAQIHSFERNVAWEHPDYRSYRWRASLTGHKRFLEKWGVKRYISFDEELPR